MAIRNIRRQATNPQAAPGTPNSAPIYVDSDDNILKMIPAGSGTTEVQIVDASSTQTLTGKTFGTTMTAGAGFSAAETYKSTVIKEGNMIVTRIVLDLTGLHGSTTDLDIIGNVGAASAHIGQITAAVNGAIFGGRVTCLELPAGGVTDIDLYSAVESTGTEDAGVAALTETALVTAGGVWTNGATKGFTAVPAANEYLYLTNGAGGTVGTFSAGKYEIVLYGS